VLKARGGLRLGANWATDRRTSLGRVWRITVSLGLDLRFSNRLFPDD